MTEDLNKPQRPDSPEHPDNPEVQGVPALVDGRGLLGAASSSGQPDQGSALQEPTQFGNAKYVHAAFFSAAIIVGYIVNRCFSGIWNWLTERAWAIHYLPQLLRYSEEERADAGLVAGAVVGILFVVYLYRRRSIRDWADEVTGELAKVTWPDREAITNGTIIVIAASLIATFYVAVLDRFWGFATELIYRP